MGQDPRKRQRKLEKRKAKQKAERREIARRESRGLVGQFHDASAFPILHCCAAADLWKQGLGNVLVSRHVANNMVAFAVILVDVYCLGVKNVMIDVVPRARYDRDVYGRIADQARLVPLKPECARKLVEGAVAYAMEFGLTPHRDYHTAKLIFGDVDPTACTEQYRYGKDGKPFFVAGPYDGPAKCRQILLALENRLGPDGYHFVMPGDGISLGVDPFADEGLLPP